jgi:hypothetical protein
MVLPSLWVTPGEAPAKERFANVHYRRAFLLAISAPKLSWTRVIEYVAFDSWGRLIGFRDPVRGMPHEFGEVIHSHRTVLHD